MLYMYMYNYTEVKLKHSLRWYAHPRPGADRTN